MAMRGAVAAGHAVTASIAADILRAGGNAYDATIAALWGACVAEPVLASPAGGGFLIARRGGQRPPELFDFFAATPLRKKADGPIDFCGVHADFGTATQEFHIGAGAAATPGFVPGLFAVHEALASIPMADLIAPAARAAREGIAITPFQAEVIKIVRPILEAEAASRALYLPGGTALAAGAPFTTPGLADALELIAEGGEAVMRDGALGKEIIARVSSGGHLTHDDLASYEVIRRAPISRSIDGARVWTNPAPAAGGLMVLLILTAMAGGCGAPALARAIDLADRLRRGEVPGGAPRDEELIGELARIAALQAGRGTTHVSVIDDDGNAAAATVTNGEGNGQMVAGFMVNNMLGEADLLPNGFERWQEGVRLASMMAPSLMEHEGSIIALGSGGSNRIRSAVSGVIVNLLRGMPLGEAIARPRLHVEDGHLDFEDLHDAAERARLAALISDHRAWPERSVYFGGVHAVRRHRDGSFEAVGDARRAGAGLVVE